MARVRLRPRCGHAAEPALKAAGLAPRGEVRRYDASHFDIYVGDVFERAVSDQVEFLAQHLLESVRES